MEVNSTSKLWTIWVQVSLNYQYCRLTEAIFFALVCSFSQEHYENYTCKAETTTLEWKIVDAKDQILGRLAVSIANTLRGRDKPTYTPHVDTGDFVIVINADKVKVTGSKEDQEKIHVLQWLCGRREMQKCLLTLEER